MFFRAAHRHGLIDRNPFEDIKGNATSNKSREYFVGRDEADKVLAACPNNRWRLIFALSRYGGLRCPSEHLQLRTSDVNWEQNKLRITAPKTEHHEGKEERWIPIFPELRPYLEIAWHEADGDGHLIEGVYSDRNNWRTQMKRIIRKSGLTPWPKTFHNMRATRETELCEQFPLHVVCYWIGNSQLIAQKHYLQVTDDHFAAAVTAFETPAKKATQNPTHTTSEMRRIRRHQEVRKPRKTLVF